MPRQNSGTDLIWPFTMASYETSCPNGHPITLSTGYSVYAPSEWEQLGKCEICNRDAQRTVGIVVEKFVAGPTHWYGESPEAETIWLHDVLNHHDCPRCKDLGKKSLAAHILNAIDGGSELAKVREIASTMAQIP